MMQKQYIKGERLELATLDFYDRRCLEVLFWFFAFLTGVKKDSGPLISRHSSSQNVAPNRRKAVRAYRPNSHVWTLKVKSTLPQEEHNQLLLILYKLLILTFKNFCYIFKITPQKLKGILQVLTKWSFSTKIYHLT